MIQIDSAIGNGWDALGAAIRASRLEDSSGSRRYYYGLMLQGRFVRVSLALNITEDRAREIYRAILDSRPH